jgi:regulatory protein
VWKRSRKSRPEAADTDRRAQRSSEPGAVNAAAAALLARRDYARGELESRLVEQGFVAGAVAALLDKLTEQRIIDDARYAERYVAFQAGRGYGPQRVRRKLTELGLAPELVVAALDAGPDWRALAREQRARRFGSEVPSAWKDKARQARFLQYRGFSTDHIHSALGAADLDLDP